jgi:hypothetical protein
VILEPEYYRKASIRFLHYAKPLFCQIYPLSKNEFELGNLSRRAADDYIAQVVEKSSEMVERTIRCLGKSIFDGTYRGKFEQAKQLQILPATLGDSLISIGKLRNKIAHHNETVNENLLVYSQMGLIIATAFAMYELTKVFHQQLSGLDTPTEDILIDKNYLFGFPTSAIYWTASGGFQHKGDLEKQKLRLQNDITIPVFKIDIAAIKVICFNIR